MTVNYSQPISPLYLCFHCLSFSCCVWTVQQQQHTQIKKKVGTSEHSTVPVHAMAGTDACWTSVIRIIHLSHSKYFVSVKIEIFLKLYMQAWIVQHVWLKIPLEWICVALQYYMYMNITWPWKLVEVLLLHIQSFNWWGCICEQQESAVCCLIFLDTHS